MRQAERPQPRSPIPTDRQSGRQDHHGEFSQPSRLAQSAAGGCRVRSLPGAGRGTGGHQRKDLCAPARGAAARGLDGPEKKRLLFSIRRWRGKSNLVKPDLCRVLHGPVAHPWEWKSPSLSPRVSGGPGQSRRGWIPAPPLSRRTSFAGMTATVDFRRTAVDRRTDWETIEIALRATLHQVGVSAAIRRTGPGSSQAALPLPPHRPVPGLVCRHGCWRRTLRRLTRTSHQCCLDRGRGVRCQARAAGSHGRCFSDQKRVIAVIPAKLVLRESGERESMPTPRPKAWRGFPLLRE